MASGVDLPGQREDDGGYCPLDLYSGEEVRVTSAVRALWDGWRSSHGQANNLRLFLDGCRLEPDDVSPSAPARRTQC